MLALPLLLSALATFSVPAQGDLTAKMDALMEKEIQGPGFVGASVAVVADGKIVLAKGYGQTALVGGREVRRNDRFSIGSVTKQFTAACAMLLIEDGKLSLDDPVSKYVKGVTQGDRITVRQLMGHVSGLRDYYPLDYVNVEMSRPTTAAKIVAKYGSMPLDFEPDTRWSYSNTGYTVLGLIVEKVAGRSLADVMRDRIFRPLGMTHTALESRPTKVRGSVQGHSSLGLDPLRTTDGEGTNWTGAAGAIASTAEDLARWNLALMEGRALRPASIAQMTTSGTLANGKKTNYGYGLMLGTVGGAPFWNHGGATDGFVTANTLLPGRKASVVVLTNSTLWGPGRVVWPLLSIATDGAVTKPDPSMASTDSPSFVPAVSGPPTDVAVRTLIDGLRDGKVDESTITDDFRFYLSPDRRKRIVERMKSREPVGEIKFLDRGERGGMEVAVMSIMFGPKRVTALSYREPNGHIAQIALFD